MSSVGLGKYHGDIDVAILKPGDIAHGLATTRACMSASFRRQRVQPAA